MVRKIINTFASPVLGLHQAAYLLAGLTLASQLLSLLRDRIFAHIFGAGEVLDLYYAAFKIPDLVFTLVVSLVSAYVLIPRITDLFTENKKEQVRELLSQMTGFLLITGGIICLIVALFAPSILFFLFPTFLNSVHASEFVFLTRLLLLQPILLGLSSILGSVTQVRRRYALFALSPVLYNLGIILGTVLLYPKYGLTGIGIGVLVGALFHLALHIPLVYREGLFSLPSVPQLKNVRGVIRDSIPRSLALGMGSVTMLLLLSIAGRLGEGSISVFTFAINLSAVPLSLIGAAYATAAFPALASQFSSAKFEAFKATVTTAARHIIFWSSVITVLTIVLRAHIVRIILGTGSFNWDDTRLTAAILAILIVGLLAQGIILLASRAFFAARRSWNPFFVQLADAGVSVVSALVLLHVAVSYPFMRDFMEVLLRIEGVPGTLIVFVALGAVIGQVSMAIVALITLRTILPGVARTLLRPLLEGLSAGILGGFATYGMLSLLGVLAPLTKLHVVFTETLIAGTVGLVVAGATLALLENKEFLDLRASLRTLTSKKTRPSLTPFAPMHDQ